MAARKDHAAVKATRDQLTSIVERIERLQEERKSISDDIRDVYAEAKANGYDARAIKTIVKRRTQDQGELAAQDEILETYMQALGML